MGGAVAPAALSEPYDTFFTAGGFQVPSMIDGSFSFGQYSRSIKQTCPWARAASSTPCPCQATRSERR
jgi:hypothetical protein